MAETAWTTYGKPWQGFDIEAVDAGGRGYVREIDSFRRDFPGDEAVGLEIELADGRHLLIGDINTLGGVCDDCREISDATIIVRYRRVYSPSSRPANVG